MILHIAGLDKFIPPFVKLVNKDFSEQNHVFKLYGSTDDKQLKKIENVRIVEPTRWKRIPYLLSLIPSLHRAEKVILHGLFDVRLVVLLAFMPWLLPKCYWLIWGGDLYAYNRDKKRLLRKVSELFRAFVIKRMGHLVTYIPGDVELARLWYGARGAYHECLMYLSNTVSAGIEVLAAECTQSNGATRLLVGNSADPSNNHFETFQKLLRYKEHNIEIFVPLSYGNPEHAAEVIKHGRKLFGDKFLPLTEFMSFDQYKAFLNSIDIAIFNHKRQQAMGNTITLIALGKKVYLRSDVTQWQFFREKGLNVFDIDEINLSTLNFQKAQENVIVVKDYFSIENYKQQLKEIFG